MPTDVHGHTHAGTRGLFDDEDERQQDAARTERHQYKRAEAQISRLQRRDARTERKAQKAASKTSPWRSIFLGKLLSSSNNSSPDATSTPLVARERPKVEYVIERKLPTPEPVYTAEDVDPVDSVWLRECGMVKVRSDDPGGCHIVPKSVVGKSE